MIMNSSSEVNLICVTYGTDMSPYLLAALSPKALESASPGPHEFLPGAHNLIGPTNLSLLIYDCLTTPP